MEIDIHQLLQDNSLLLTFVVIGFGYLVGRIRIGTIELGSKIGRAHV